jgi:phosphoglycolate phosphatase-like HAD superfamily hydrolase
LAEILESSEGVMGSEKYGVQMRPDTVVFDLDGTLANLDHRRPMLDDKPPRWDDFYEACEDDKPNEWLFTVLRTFQDAGFKIQIVSARRFGVLRKTLAWLYQYIQQPFELSLVRPDGDYTPDTILKKKWLDEYGKDRILCVFDDRQKVVDMWRKEGVKCAQVDKWDEKNTMPCPTCLTPVPEKRIMKLTPEMIKALDDADEAGKRSWDPSM